MRGSARLDAAGWGVKAARKWSAAATNPLLTFYYDALTARNNPSTPPPQTHLVPPQQLLVRHDRDVLHRGAALRGAAARRAGALLLAWGFA
jgi:hypothetical protein